MGSIDKVLGEFDSVIRQNVATAAQNPTYLIDASSLLWRLEVRMLIISVLQVCMSVVSGEWWKGVCLVCTYVCTYVVGSAVHI